MFRVLTLIVLPTVVILAAIIPGRSATPSPSPTPDRAPMASPTPTQAENEADVLRVIKSQQIDWNHGDLEGFMDAYWKSHDTMFVVGDTVTRGWQTVHNRYVSKYNSREKMGKLSFSDLEVHMFGYDGAFVFGRWQLERDQDKPHGRFTLILRKLPEGWKIVHDHTSEAAEQNS
jgi:ketosteroid isomerase-like protein